MNTKKILAAGLGSCLLALAMTACGESTETAKGNFCDSLDDFSSTAMNYQGLDPATATNAQLESAADDLDAAWDDVVQDAGDWVYADDNELTEAYDDLYDAAQDLPDDNTVSEDLDALQPQLDAIPQAYYDTFDGSGCSTAS
jgi:hypothetical protein